MKLNFCYEFRCASVGGLLNERKRQKKVSNGLNVLFEECTPKDLSSGTSRDEDIN